MSNETDEIKQRLNLVELITEYVPQLKRAGSNWKACCPFHNEKTPSFMVSDEKQIWHCFGCSKGGDHFAFVQEIENMEFPEALRMLAKKAGVEIRQRDPKLETKKTRLADLLGLAAKYYHKVLLESKQAEPAREYLKQRNVDDTTIDHFLLGYAIDSWDDCHEFLAKKGYSEEEIFDAGLTVKKEKGTGSYNRFRKRLMFPFHDLSGSIIGFGGRLLDPEAKEVKYVNTPETALYHKGSYLYGLFHAKSTSKEKKQTIIVEGYMDVLSSWQSGIENVVASGGTALTPNQARLLKRFAPAISLSFDADAAGVDAARRGVDIAWEIGLEVKIIDLPFGKDPDEVIQKDAKAWKQATEKAEPFMEYYFARAEKKYNLDELDGKKETTKLLLPLIAKIPDGLEQTHYVQKLAKLVNVDENIIKQKLAKPLQPVRNESDEKPDAPETSRDIALAERLLAIGVAYPKEHLSYIVDHVKPEHFPTREHQQLYKWLIVQYTQSEDTFTETIGKAIEAESRELQSLFRAIELLGEELREQGTVEAAKDDILISVFYLTKQYLHHTLSQLEREMRVAEEQRDKEKLNSLSEQAQEAMDELAKLRDPSE